MFDCLGACCCAESSFSPASTVCCRISAKDALHWGLVSNVLPLERLLPEALALAGRIAGLSRPAVTKAKGCVLAAQDLPLSDGLVHEK